MFLNFFSQAPFGVSYFYPRPTTIVPCEDCCPSFPKKLQMGPFDIYKHLGSFTLFRLGYELSSLAVLFHGTYPEISSGGGPQTFVHTVSFGVWQNQSKFEAE